MMELQANKRVIGVVVSLATPGVVVGVLILTFAANGSIDGEPHRLGGKAALVGLLRDTTGINLFPIFLAVGAVLLTWILTMFLLSMLPRRPISLDIDMAKRINDSSANTRLREFCTVSAAHGVPATEETAAEAMHWILKNRGVDYIIEESREGFRIVGQERNGGPANTTVGSSEYAALVGFELKNWVA